MRLTFLGVDRYGTIEGGDPVDIGALLTGAHGEARLRRHPALLSTQLDRVLRDIQSLSPSSRRRVGTIPPAVWQDGLIKLSLGHRDRPGNDTENLTESFLPFGGDDGF